MKFLSISKDGGPESHVWAYWLVEIKPWFSIAILRFEHGTRDSFHSHAFNAISWLLWGQLGETLIESPDSTWWYYPSLRPIITRRTTFHRVFSQGRSWVLTFRGPWAKSWSEYLPDQGEVELTHGRIPTPKDSSC